jgi:hypothetical protein
VITDAINSAAAAAWAYYATFQFLDPFWGWLCILLAIYAVVMLVCYFFGSFWPFLRVVGGFMLLALTFGLFAYARGERDARAHDRRAAPRPPPQRGSQW